MARSSRSSARIARQSSSKKETAPKKPNAPNITANQKAETLRNRKRNVNSTTRTSKNSVPQQPITNEMPANTKKRRREISVEVPSRSNRSKKQLSPPTKKIRTRSSIRQSAKQLTTKLLKTSTTQSSTTIALRSATRVQPSANKSNKEEKNSTALKTKTSRKKVTIAETRKTNLKKSPSDVKVKPSATKPKNTKLSSPLPVKRSTKRTKLTKTVTTRTTATITKKTNQSRQTRGGQSTQRSIPETAVPSVTRARRSMHRSKGKVDEEIFPDQSFQKNEVVEKNSTDAVENCKSETTVNEGLDERDDETKTTENTESSSAKDKEELMSEHGKRKLDCADNIENKKPKLSSKNIDTQVKTKIDEEGNKEKSTGITSGHTSEAVKLKVLKLDDKAEIIPQTEEKENSEEQAEITNVDKVNIGNNNKHSSDTHNDDTVNSPKHSVSIEERNESDNKLITESKVNLVSEDISEDKVQKIDVTPTANGVSYETKEISMISHSNSAFSTRKFIWKSEFDNKSEDKFSLVSYNIKQACDNSETILDELRTLDADILCLQEVDKNYYSDKLQPLLKSNGYRDGVYHNGLVTLCKNDAFDLIDDKDCDIDDKQLDVYHFVKKDVENSSLEDGEKQALKSFLCQPARALYVKLKSVKTEKKICVCNTNLSDVDLSLHALQLAVLMRDLTSQSEGSLSSHIICGTLNLKDRSPGSQLLKDGYLSNEMIEDLQSRKDVPIPNKDNAALINLLWKCFQHTSTSLKSSYGVILGDEDVKLLGSRDSMWHSSESLNVVGVLDIVKNNDSNSNHFALKAQFSFIN